MARITKKQIYAKYGIEYKSGKILSPVGEWINPLLPVGTNIKLNGKPQKGVKRTNVVASWSMLHGCETYTKEDFYKRAAAVMELYKVDSIKASCPCHCAHCYCDSGCYNFDSTKACNLRKLILARLYMEWTERAIKAQLEADHVDQVRIHAAGDFFSPEYVEMWKRIALAFPNVTFWTYTKYAPALEAFADLENLSIVPSNTPAGLNFGTCKDLLKTYKRLVKAGARVHICGCGTPYEKHCADCKTGCKAVGRDCDFVLFILHSTPDYKAGEKDPEEFAKVCEIIAKQNN